MHCTGHEDPDDCAPACDQDQVVAHISAVLPTFSNAFQWIIGSFSKMETSSGGSSSDTIEMGKAVSQEPRHGPLWYSLKVFRRDPWLQCCMRFHRYFCSLSPSIRKTFCYRSNLIWVRWSAFHKPSVIQCKYLCTKWLPCLPRYCTWAGVEQMCWVWTGADPLLMVSHIYGFMQIL